MILFIQNCVIKLSEFYLMFIINLKKSNVDFKEQVSIPLKYQGEKIGNYFLDFLIDNKVILEIKKGDYFSRTNINQIFAYLKAANLQLGLLANFTTSGIK